jgi:hypothetical protein
LTLGYPLANAGYTKYRIFAASSPRSLTYRDYIFTDPYVAAHLVKRFPVPVSWSYGGRGVSGTVDYPAAGIQWEQVVVPGTFDLVPGEGKVRFHEPTVMVYSSQAQLRAGGAEVVKPDDLIVVVPVNRGNLSVASPPDVGGIPQYTGTASEAPVGLRRTLTIPVPAWNYRADLANMQALADMRLAAVRDVLIEGTVTYHGYYATGLLPGRALDLAHPTLTTGFEAMHAPIRSCTLEWPQSGGSLFKTTLQVSNRRNPYTGDRLFEHPGFLSMEWDHGFSAHDFGLAGYEEFGLGPRDDPDQLPGPREPAEVAESGGESAGFGGSAEPAGVGAMGDPGEDGPPDAPDPEPAADPPDPPEPAEVADAAEPIPWKPRLLDD